MTGIEIGPLVASLGIGGLAFALAGKDIDRQFPGEPHDSSRQAFPGGREDSHRQARRFVEGEGFAARAAHPPQETGVHPA